MALDEIYNHFNLSRMRDQLSELSVAPYGYRMNGTSIPPLVSIKDDYRTAHLASHAQKLELLLEAQETGR